ncbi:3-oxoacyl-[acyl-carrier-protein] synthase 2 [compost metagenome]
MGYLLIKQGLQERVVCGGAQEINVYAMSSFDGLGAFSVRDDHASKASRPFDRDRDGLVPSGGAATVIIEMLRFMEKLLVSGFLQTATTFPIRILTVSSDL